MTLTENEKRIVLESLKAHSEEGWNLLGHYGSDDDSGEARALGERLCKDLGIEVDGRDWIKG